MRFTTLSSTSLGSRPPNSPPPSPRDGIDTAACRPPRRTLYERLSLSEDFRVALRSNNAAQVAQMLDGGVFNAKQVRWLHRLANRGVGRQAPDAARLLRAVKAHVAFHADKALVSGTATEARDMPLTERQVELVGSAFQRGDIDELKNLLEGQSLSIDQLFFLVQLGARLMPD